MWCKTIRNKGTGWLALSCIFFTRSHFKTRNTMYQRHAFFILLGIPAWFCSLSWLGVYLMDKSGGGEFT